jgi:hypothetical protein
LLKSLSLHRSISLCPRHLAHDRFVSNRDDEPRWPVRVNLPERSLANHLLTLFRKLWPKTKEARAMHGLLELACLGFETGGNPPFSASKTGLWFVTDSDQSKMYFHMT